MIKSVNSCLNCENLVESLKCAKHDVDVEIDNVCNDHSIKKAFSKLSDCISCSNYKKYHAQILVTQQLECCVSLGLRTNFIIGR